MSSENLTFLSKSESFTQSIMKKRRFSSELNKKRYWIWNGESKNRNEDLKNEVKNYYSRDEHLKKTRSQKIALETVKEMFEDISYEKARSGSLWNSILCSWGEKVLNLAENIGQCGIWIMILEFTELSSYYSIIIYLKAISILKSNSKSGLNL